MTGASTGHLALFARSLSGSGGAERVVVNLAGALAQRGHRVDLVLARCEGKMLQDLSDSVRLFDLGSPSPLALRSLVASRPADFLGIAPALAIPGGSRVLRAAPALARYLEAHRPRALLSALNYSNVAAVLAKRLAPDVGTRIAISVHNHLSTSTSRKRSLRAVPRLARRFFPGADRIVAVSQGVADDLGQLIGVPADAISTIHNPVLTPEVYARADAEPDHPWLRCAGPPVVLGAGKLEMQKDFPTLLRAFARLREQRPARLVILGEGSQRRKLLALAQRLGIGADVDFPGFAANPFALMARASAFVLSSAWEGFGNVLVEAMACGCPVVSTDCPSGPAEILAGGVYGPLVSVGNSEVLASSIGQVLDDPPDAGTLRKRAEKFTAQRAAELYERVLLGGGGVASE